MVGIDVDHLIREAAVKGLEFKFNAHETRRPAGDGSTEKKVVLITATPLNNCPEDIRNQIYLFLDSKQSTLEVGNLQHLL